MNRLVFCMFAEDIRLLPHRMFTRMLEASRDDPASFEDNARTLFRAMAQKGGQLGFTPIDWFNGGLFDDDGALPLTGGHEELILAARLDWSQIEPSIFGTLFERGLDPDKRSQFGAHYTDPQDHDDRRPGDPRPAERRMGGARRRCARCSRRRDAYEGANCCAAPSGGPQEGAAEAEALHGPSSIAWRASACSTRPAAPAISSICRCWPQGHRAARQSRSRGAWPASAVSRRRPGGVLGIELNPYAAELARVSVWIGEIQWMRQHGFSRRKPGPAPLDDDRVPRRAAERRRQAEPHGRRRMYRRQPAVSRRQTMIGLLGEDYATRLRDAYSRAACQAVPISSPTGSRKPGR